MRRLESFPSRYSSLELSSLLCFIYMLWLLSLQIYAEAKKFAKIYNLHVVCAYGGGSMYEQQKACAESPEIIVCTPGEFTLLSLSSSVYAPQSILLALPPRSTPSVYPLSLPPQSTLLLHLYYHLPYATICIVTKSPIKCVLWTADLWL